MWLCVMQHIRLFTLNGKFPPVALPHLGSPPGTQLCFLEWAGEFSALLTQPGKPLRRAESDCKKWRWLGRWFVFPARSYQKPLWKLKQSLFLREALCFKAEYQKGSISSCSFFFDCKTQPNYTYDKASGFLCVPGETHTNTLKPPLEKSLY